MAYVAISQRLKGEIRSEIITMRNKELASLQQPKTLAESVTPEQIEEKLWGQYSHLKTVLPDAWINRDSTYMYLRGYDLEGRLVLNEHTHSGKIPRPPKHDSELKFTQEEMPIIGEWIEWKARRTEIMGRWEAINTQVYSFLAKSKSLNEAVKLAPELLHYVPTYLKEKLEEKVVRAPRDKVSAAANALLNLDRDALVGGAVAARLAEANNGSQ